MLQKKKKITLCPTEGYDHDVINPSLQCSKVFFKTQTKKVWREEGWGSYEGWGSTGFRDQGEVRGGAVFSLSTAQVFVHACISFYLFLTLCSREKAPHIYT